MQKIYHFSYDKLIKIEPNKPMWFTEKLNISKAYYKINHHGYVYECETSGNFIDEKDLKSVCKNFGINYNDFVGYLVCNPQDIMENHEVKTISQTYDGIYHLDYDPRDSHKYVISLLIFNPNAIVKIIKEV